MDEKQFKYLEKKLDNIQRLLAIQVSKNESKEKQATILKSAGLSSTEIGTLLGKSPGTVRSQTRKKKPKIKKDKISNS